MIQFDSSVCTNFESASRREWLETNGIGGFASGTISGAGVRRYNGLLIAATKPPLGRLVLLSKFEETLSIDGKSFELSANQYPNAVYPEGYKYLKSFRLDPFPVWVFEVEGVEIQKTVFMIHGENSTVVQYQIRNSAEEGENHPRTNTDKDGPKKESKGQKAKDKGRITLELKPLLAFRDYHHLRSEDANFNSNFAVSENQVSIQPDAEMPELFFAHNAVGGGVEKTGLWYRNFEYAVERERGFDFREDLFQPFNLKFDLSQSAAAVIVSTQTHDLSDVLFLREREIARRENLIKQAAAAVAAEDDFTRQLVLAADQFVVSRGEGQTIIAGYPWFSDWGRDTMISLPGLTLATNRPEIAKSILLEFSKHISEGMLPNRFPDAGELPEYNTVDATLWYFEAVRAYAEKTKDYDFIRKNLYVKLAETVAWHLRGTRYQIHVDTDGLLYAGTGGVQLTWMDAKIGDLVITPRVGKAVEIQALWYNALKVMADFAERFGDKEDKNKYEAMAAAARLSFNQVFWNEAEQCLFDVVINGTRDASVRPNQIFAVSLHHTMIRPQQARKVVEKVEAELLTPFGLRSLSPKDPQYCPVYIGSPFERDSAYHQGTVWAWLTGAFVDALRKVSVNGEETETKVREILSHFERHLREAGVGQISEIFDADPPYAPRGCFAQAWSVAEILRVLS